MVRGLWKKLSKFSFDYRWELYLWHKKFIESNEEMLFIKLFFKDVTILNRAIRNRGSVGKDAKCVLYTSRWRSAKFWTRVGCNSIVIT